MKNIYGNPEDFGLSFIGEVDLEECHYSFYVIGLWRNELGYYLATDSGCSCPSPFENYDGLDDLTGPLSATQAAEEATSLWRDAGAYAPEDFENFVKLIS